MNKILKKAVALALALCSVAGLLVPMTKEASAATYTLPEYMSYQEMGIVLRGNPNLPGQVEIAEMNGRQYIGVPIKGGEFYVFDLTACIAGEKNKDGNFIYAKVEDNIGIPRGIALDSKGTFYVTGDSKSVFWYNIKTGKSGQIPTNSSGLTTVAVDEKDNVYAVGKISGGAGVFKLNTANNTSQLIYETSDFTTIQGVAAAEGKVYALGAVKNDLGGGAEVRMLNDQGKVLSSYNARGSTVSYYMTWLDGVLFVGANAASTDGLLALDTAGNTLSRISIGMDAPINGFVTKEYNGKAYMALYGEGIFEYNVKNRRIGQKVNGTGHRELRCRNFIEYEGNVCMISVGPSSITRTGIGVGYISNGLGDLLEGAGSTFSARSMVSGVAGTGVAVYVGAYLSGSVGSYSPNAATPMNGSAFSNGHAQTDSMLQYKGKIYGGIYSGAYLIQYDPATNEVTELIHGLKDDYQQLRIHALAAGDNKIFFGTIPEDQALGGAIGWYDLTTGESYVERNVVKDQAIIALTYDESKDILYIGTTIRGGTNSTATAEQAVVAAYDVKTKKVLATAQVDSITGDKPKNISGRAQDPDTGKIWGVVAQTVFSLSYEGGKLKVTKEWKADTVPSDAYPDGGSRSWFPRNILFDGKGNMYIGMLENKYGTMRFALNADNKIQSATTVVQNTSRIYSMGSDGNLYLYGDQLYKVTLPDRAGIVKNLIDSAKASSKDSVEQARSAYDALTAKEKKNLGADYLNKLIALEEGETSPELDVIIAIEDIGAVTLNSATKIQAARNLYNKLTAAQKNKVTNYQTLVNAEKAYEALVNEQNKPTEPTVPPTTVPPTTVPEESVPAVDHVQETINAIKAIGRVTPASGPAIENARTTYDSLTAEQKKKVTNYQTLVDAEAAYKKLVSSETVPDETIPDAPEDNYTETTTPDDHPNATPAEDVIDAIYAIGAVNQQSGKAISAARQMYEELTAQEKALVINYQTLVEAEKLYEALMNQEETPDETEPEETTPENTTPENTTPEETVPEGTTPEETVPEGTDEPILNVPTTPDEEELDTAVIITQVQINAIGEVTRGSGPVIQAARESYDALTPAQQAQVNNAQALFDAEKAFAALSQNAPSQDAEQGSESNMLVYVIIGAGVVVVAAVIVVVVLTKKKKAPVSDDLTQVLPQVEIPESTEE